MIITCNRILFPPQVDEEDMVIREAKMKQMAKNIRKRKISFSVSDIEKISEHEDTRFTEVWFYYSEPIVIEYSFEALDTIYKAWNESHEEEEDDGTFRFWIPAN